MRNETEKLIFFGRFIAFCKFSVTVITLEYSIEEKEIAFKEQQDAEQHAEVMEDLRKILHEDWGRRYLWRLLSFCRVMDRSMDRDALVMAFREGQRDIGMRLMKDIDEAEITAYNTMRMEHYNDEKERAATRDKMRKKFYEEEQA